ncbi:Disease resistance protein RPP8 [Rhynchospora pubera]|uniref:Disease resistance protein RPP8 n=1 Tax=Rhynchospora pubera TaxID=906938 RepID=A0AAV8GBN4_9POAL|nr:Disease resistance protein RPP8 [Rhynchospora pubera]
MSYKDMPYHLKDCFLYLASFPEDYEIRARRLIRMWVAEKLIPYDEKKTMELKAEGCLEQLVHRSMIQVSSRHFIGSIKSCRVHDLLRDLAMHHAEKENFVTVFPKPQGVNHPHRVVRRASLQSVDYAEFLNYADKNTRSLLRFGQFQSRPTEIIKFSLLRVVQIENASIIISGLDGLIHMKYLELRDCAIFKWPSNFSWFRLKNLETLDCRRTRFPDSYPHFDIPPTDLWKIGTLRHVLYSSLRRNALEGPPSNADLTNLQSLGWVTGAQTWRKNQLPCLKNLRKLKFDNDAFCGEPRIDWNVVGHLLGTLPYLQTLKIVGYEIPKEIVYPRGLPNYQNLQTLYFHGGLGVNKVEASSFPKYLVKLTLIESNLKEDPMPELGRLKNLQKLRLENTVYTGSEMICPVGFPVLQTLWLNLSVTNSLTIMEGVMPKLKRLTNQCLTTINLPRELSHLQP